jgi:hypothetical protein
MVESVRGPLPTQPPFTSTITNHSEQPARPPLISTGSLFLTDCFTRPLTTSHRLHTPRHDMFSIIRPSNNSTQEPRQGLHARGGAQPNTNTASPEPRMGNPTTMFIQSPSVPPSPAPKADSARPIPRQRNRRRKQQQDTGSHTLTVTLILILTDGQARIKIANTADHQQLQLTVLPCQQHPASSIIYISQIPTVHSFHPISISIYLLRLDQDLVMPEPDT